MNSFIAKIAWQKICQRQSVRLPFLFVQSAAEAGH
jgi:hypothetical protein